MKKDIHAKDYRLVVFEDLNDASRILTRSTVRTDETIKWEDGNTYPLVKVHITSSSHPFYTGQEKVLDLEGRVDRFKNRQKAAEAAAEARKKAASKTRVKKDKPKEPADSEQ